MDPRKLSKRDMERMCVPEEFWWAKLDEVAELARPTMARYAARIEEMVRKPAGFLLYGKSGVGKTSAAVVMLKAARQYGMSGYFATIWSLREFVRTGVQYDDSSSILDRCRDVDLLVLDHLRLEDVDEKIVNLSTLEELVSYRSAHHRATIITTQLEPKTGANVFRAFISCVGGSILEYPIDGPDKRVAQRNALKSDLIVLAEKK